MKVLVIITTLMVVQVSASFFDVFQGAVLSVQNSFGKLLSDVVTDVKETVDCTILAVEHVLSLSHDATTRYYHKCGSETNKTDSVSDARQDASLPKVEVTLNLPNNLEYLRKVIPAEIDARINETLSKVLGNFKPHDNVLSIENVLAKESEQLAGVSVLVKKELEKLPNEVSKDLKKMEKQRDSEASVDTILQELKVLEKRAQNSKNTSEANEIHLVIDQVLGKLDAIKATEATENFKLEEILKGLESNSNNNLVELRHQLEEWKEEESRHLIEIKSKIEVYEKLTHHPGPYNRHESNHTQPVIFNMYINKYYVETNENSQDKSNYNTTQVEETLDNSTSTRTIGDTNDKSLLVANSSSSSQNYTFNKLNDTVITSTSYSSIESPNESVMFHPFENPIAYAFSKLTTLSANIQNNVIRINTNETVTNTLEVIDRAPVNKTIQPIQSIPYSDKQQSLASNEPNFLLINENNANETVIISTKTLNASNSTESTSTSITDNDGKTTITRTATTIIRTSLSESETIQAVDTTTLSTSEEKYLSSTANRLTKTPNTADDDEDIDEDDDNDDDDDDSSTTVVMTTTEAISESISEVNILATKDEELLPSTKIPLKTSPVTLMDTDSNSDDIITRTSFPISQIITVSEVTDLVESTTFTEHEEPSILSPSPATVRDEVPIENIDSSVTVPSKSENTDSALVTEIIQRVETTTPSEEQELSSTSTQSAMNKMVTSTALPTIESIPTSGSVMAYKHKEDSGEPPRLEQNTSWAPEVLNSPTLNLIVRSPPLAITLPVNREWLTPNKFNQQNYNTNGEQRNNYEFKGPKSSSDRLLQTRQPPINSEVPIYGQAAMPPITTGLFNNAPKWLPPNGLIPDFPSQPPNIDNDALQEAAFEIFDSAHELLSHSDSPFSPEKDIFRNIAFIPNTPREPMGSSRMYYENPSYVPPSQNPIPYSFDSAPENTYRQLSLTTHRPARTAAHANNYKNPSFDYGSFFHLRDPEAHQRALKEARQLMANAKRSDRIINNIMKNKNKFNARSIFG